MTVTDPFNTQKAAAKAAAAQAQRPVKPAHKPAQKSGGKAPQGAAAGSTGTSGASVPIQSNEEDNAQRFLASKGKLVRYCESLGGWQVWHEPAKAWVGDPRDVKIIGMGREMVSGMRSDARALFLRDPAKGEAWLKWANRSATSGAITSMLRLARSDREVLAEEFDANPAAIAAAGSLVELRPDGSVRERSISVDDLCRHNTGTRYVAGAGHPAWDAFLSTFLPDKIIRTWVQAYVGYSLYGGNPERKFVVIRGDTTSGKTFFLNCIYKALGSYAGVFGLQMLRAKQDSDLNPGLVRIAPRRFAYVEESGDAWHLHVDEMKRLTGDGAMIGRLPFASAPVEMEARFTPWMATNDVPTIEGADRALKRRLVFIPFTHSLAEGEERTDLRSVVHETAFKEAVLAWAVEGWGLYRANGLEVPAEAAEFNMQLRSELNHFELFLSEMCVIDPDAYVVPLELYTAYRAWCEDNGITGREVYTATKLGRTLSANGIGSANDRVRVDGAPVRVRRGLRIR